MRSLAPVLLVPILSLPAWGQTPTAPALRTHTQIVVVDVSVTDAKGNPVRGLKPSDFTLTEDKAVQAISSFEEHQAPTEEQLAKLPSPPKLPPGIFSNIEVTPTDLPLNIVLFDSLNTQPADQPRIRQQMLKFLSSAPIGHRIAIFDLTERLSLLQSFTADPEVLRKAINQPSAGPRKAILTPDAEGSVSTIDQLSRPDVVRNETHTIGYQAQLRAQITIEAMSILARYLSGFSGRKNLIWFSGSFPVNMLPSGRYANPFSVMGTNEQYFRETVALLARSQVAIYPIQARGMLIAPAMEASNNTMGQRLYVDNAAGAKDLSQFSSNLFEQNSSMQRMAESTGGKAFADINDLSGAVAQAIHAGESYYTLTYSPTNKETDGKFRAISIKSSQTKVHMDYRRGYYADQPRTRVASKTAPAPPPTAMRLAIQHGAPPSTQILFKAQVVPAHLPEDKPAPGVSLSPNFKGPFRHYSILTAALPSDVSFPVNDAGRHTIAVEFLTAVYDRNGVLVSSASNGTQTVLTPEAFANIQKVGIQFNQQISVPSGGEYFIRTGIHDLVSDKTGAIELPVAAIPASAK